jgi:arylsulfatase A-like enzyme
VTGRQLAALATGALWCAALVATRPPVPAPGWVVLVSLDTVRADAVDTPHLQALAASSITFTRHFASAPSTLASHASLFTGTWPHTHGVPRNGFALAPENTTLAELLARAGYDTAGFVGARALASETAIGQGFDHWDEPAVPERPATEVVERALAWLDQRADDRPLFLFVHLYDAHAPYSAPAGYRGDLAPEAGSLADIHLARRTCSRSDALRSAYLAGVRWLDHGVGALLAGLDARGALDPALLLVTADHGEAWDAHEECWDHGQTVYDETTRIPLLIRSPSLAAGVSDRLTSNIDVLPTILDLLDLPPDPAAQGVSFAPTLRGEDQPARGVVFSEATKPFTARPPGWANADRRKSARSNDLRLVWDPWSDERQLFVSGQDAAEAIDRWDELAALPQVRALDLSLAAWVAEPQGYGSVPADDAALRALGYVGD